MTGAIRAAGQAPSIERASLSFARLMEHVAGLYCGGSSSSVSAYEAHELSLSVLYALGIVDASPEKAALALDVDDPIALWQKSVSMLEERTDRILDLWTEAVATMPPLRNVALRDTLASLGSLKRRYDAYFAAHEVPCDIDYQLSNPVDDSLMGLDYVEAWLLQLLTEARWLARFDVDSCKAVLEQVCPDYRGLHVNLYDLLLPHEKELLALPQHPILSRQHQLNNMPSFCWVCRSPTFLAAVLLLAAL